MKAKIVCLMLGLFLVSCAGSVSKPKVKRKVVAPAEKTKVFRYKGAAREVYLSGNFNGWKTNDPSFRFKEKEKGVWILEILYSRLIQGKNEYKIIVDGEWKVDPLAPQVEESILSGKIGVFILP